MVWISDCIVYMYVQEQYTWYICIYVHLCTWVHICISCVCIQSIYHICVHKLSSIQCFGSISAVVYAYIYNEFVYVL